MNSQPVVPAVDNQRRAETFFPTHRRNQSSLATPSFRFTNYEIDEHCRQAAMVIVLEDGERVEGQIEWYDRGVVKVRGRAKTLIYKSAIRYMYKLGEAGQ